MIVPSNFYTMNAFCLYWSNDCDKARNYQDLNVKVNAIERATG